MSLHPYSIENYSQNDFEKFVVLCRDTYIVDPGGYELNPSFLEKMLKRPHYSPYLDLFLAKWNEDVVGFLNIIPELRIGRVILNGFVHPRHRQRGLATKMVHSALERAEALKGKVVHVCLSESNKAAQALMRKLDFTSVRCFLELEMNISKDLKAETDRRFIDFDHFRSGEEAMLTAIQNKCFTGTWGFCPNTAEEIKYYLDLPESQLKDVIAVRSRKDESIIGYCWAQIMKSKNTANFKKKGRIHMFGIDPGHQGKGLGKALLLAGLHYLKEKGAEEVELTVDKENKEAFSLYISLGFKKISTSIWYEKRLKTSMRYPL